MVEKGLKLNLCQSKVMKCEARFRPTENLEKGQCGVCNKGVGSNTIKCNQCSPWFQWFNHVDRKDSGDWLSAYRSFEVNKVTDRGRRWKTWDECAKKDLVELGFHQEWASNRVRQRGLM